MNVQVNLVFHLLQTVSSQCVSQAIFEIETDTDSRQKIRQTHTHTHTHGHIGALYIDSTPILGLSQLLKI